MTKLRYILICACLLVFGRPRRVGRDGRCERDRLRAYRRLVRVAYHVVERTRAERAASGDFAKRDGALGCLHVVASGSRGRVRRLPDRGGGTLRGQDRRTDRRRRCQTARSVDHENGFRADAQQSDSDLHRARRSEMVQEADGREGRAERIRRRGGDVRDDGPRRSDQELRRPGLQTVRALSADGVLLHFRQQPDGADPVLPGRGERIGQHRRVRSLP